MRLRAVGIPVPLGRGGRQKPLHPIDVLLRGTCSLLLLVASVHLCSRGNARTQNSGPPRPGVTTPGRRRSMTDVHPDASFVVEGQPDWMVVTEDAVWVTSSNVNHVVRLDPATNRPSLVVAIDKPCSGLASGFGAIWVPSCRGACFGPCPASNRKNSRPDSRRPR
jgi:hypothetical protein